MVSLWCFCSVQTPLYMIVVVSKGGWWMFERKGTLHVKLLRPSPGVHMAVTHAPCTMVNMYIKVKKKKKYIKMLSIIYIFWCPSCTVSF